ncbi:protein CURVATURE THYLAKOID 1D, chloroplastic-like [Hibiscus syriacus]|uniref:protein CURVATURE THYLAKOID 1D, chloroplastic-like n=1 Tax=Hibiscus syriacus TaxID=106335 RepID=UPI001922DF0B|nr:protein CURVATURE THYLAKOID 1D, chloroplastic-like [Hibiscus syriacus]
MGLDVSFIAVLFISHGLLINSDDWITKHLQLDNEDAFSIILYGSGALVALWLASALVGAIDSIPLFPKFIEVAGLGYTFWFTSRYLICWKRRWKNREELASKIEELKQQIVGWDDK